MASLRFIFRSAIKEADKGLFRNGEKFGLNIKYLEEKEPLGTAGPLKLAEKYLDDTFC